MDAAVEALFHRCGVHRLRYRCRIKTTSNRELGKVVFEKRASLSFVLVIAAVALVCLVLGAYLLAGNYAQHTEHDAPDVIPMSLGLLAGSIILAGYAFSLQRGYFRCHEFGV